MDKYRLFGHLKEYYIQNGRIMPTDTFKKIAKGSTETEIFEAIMAFDRFLDEQRMEVNK